MSLHEAVLLLTCLASRLADGRAGAVIYDDQWKKCVLYLGIQGLGSHSSSRNKGGRKIYSVAKLDSAIAQPCVSLQQSSPRASLRSR